MPLMETFQPEAGDSRNKQIEMQRFHESLHGPDIDELTRIGDLALLEEIDKILEVPTYNPPERGAGLVLRPTSKFGHAVLDKEHIKWPQISHE